jgi:hypothetical protein
VVDEQPGPVPYRRPCARQDLDPDAQSAGGYQQVWTGEHVAAAHLRVVHADKVDGGAATRPGSGHRTVVLLQPADADTPPVGEEDRLVTEFEAAPGQRARDDRPETAQGKGAVDREPGAAHVLVLRRGD